MRIFFLAAFLISVTLVTGQTAVKGYTRGASGELLPFSTVYVKGTTNGTTSNSSGEFFLKIPSGKVTIVAQYVGYKVTEKTISVPEGKMINLDFVLDEQALQLQEVVVTAGDDDPADRVIREAIRKRKFYKDEIQAFKTDAYLKGMFRLNQRPEKILGQKIEVDTGIIYLSESVSEFSFELPDKISERMISSKVSGNEQGFSFNQASDFNINPYEKFIDLGQERDYVSPIAPNAFLFYDYKWLGLFEENGKLINKIRVEPKRDTDPVFEGIVYIVEGEWRFHTIDLFVTKARGLEFIDSLKINQVFAPTNYDIWMPISQKFSFAFGVFGFKGSGYYIGIFSNYEVEPNYQAYRDAGLYEEKFGQVGEQSLFQEEYFTPEVLFVEEGSNERDTTYWQTIRPIPLTGPEIADYRIKDSIRVVKESVPYKDSVDQERNRVTLGKIFLTGFNHSNSIDERFWTLPPVISIFQFNTVEGFVPEIEPTIYTQIDGRTKYWIRPAIRYGFSNERFNARINASYRKLDDKFTRFFVGLGRYVYQFDSNEPISPFINSFVTLVDGDNFMKIYEKSFIYGRFQQEVKNGVLLNLSAEYASRDTLTNTTDFTWASEKKTTFTSNQPANAEVSQTGFETNRALILEATVRLRFKQKYATRPDRKLIYPSKYPEVYLTYRKGLEVLGSDVNFDFVRVRVSDNMSLGLVGTSSYSLVAGSFLNSDALTFVDFQHFSGNQTSFSSTDGNLRFQLLPYYFFSTSDRFLEGHYEHHFNEFIFNKIPLVKRLNLQAVASANYLSTSAIGNYLEFGAGIEHIFKFLRIDYFWAFQDGSNFGRGLRIGVGF